MSDLVLAFAVFALGMARVRRPMGLTRNKATTRYPGHRYFRWNTDTVMYDPNNAIWANPLMVWS